MHEKTHIASTLFYRCGPSCKCEKDANSLINRTAENGTTDLLADIASSTLKQLSLKSAADVEFDLNLLRQFSVAGVNLYDLAKLDSNLKNTVIERLSELPRLAENTVSISTSDTEIMHERVRVPESQIPPYLDPHPGNPIVSCPVTSVRRLTSEGAVKHTWHVTLDISEFPLRADEEWRLGGSFGICVPNSSVWVDGLLHRLDIADDLADQPIIIETNGGRWPTVWGEDEPRKISTTRRETLMWACDFVSCPISSGMLRSFAEDCSNTMERNILMFLSSKDGSNVLKALLSEKFITVMHLLTAFPSCMPSLEKLFSLLPQLMPRWYSLANDPHKQKGVLEFAFTVVDIADRKGGFRHGVATTHLASICRTFSVSSPPSVYIFRGLQQNPFAQNFCSVGPTVLIGAGVGIAPFRGFIQRRAASSSCKGKIWIIQGCRDKTLDAIYSEDLESPVPDDMSELMSDDVSIKSASSARYLTESRAGRHEYVQDEIIKQSKLIYNVINDPCGRVYLCGSNGNFLNNANEALAAAVSKEANVSLQEARIMWQEWAKPEVARYIAEVW